MIFALTTVLALSLIVGHCTTRFCAPTRQRVRLIRVMSMLRPSHPHPLSSKIVLLWPLLSHRRTHTGRSRRSSSQRPVLLGTLARDFACIRAHESTDNYSENTGNGFYGAYQFLPSTWDSVVVTAGLARYANGRPDLAPPRVQDEAALTLYHLQGWAPWPLSSVACGL